MLSNCGAGKTLESPFDCKEIKPIHPKGNQPWMFIGRTDAEAEAPILWPPDANSLFTGKDPDAGKDWRREEKGMTEDKMVGWHHWLNGHESEQAPGDSEGQEGLECCSPWGCKESDMTEWLNNNKSRKQVSGSWEGQLQLTFAPNQEEGRAGCKMQPKEKLTLFRETCELRGWQGGDGGKLPSKTVNQHTSPPRASSGNHSPWTQEETLASGHEAIQSIAPCFHYVSSRLVNFLTTC